LEKSPATTFSVEATQNHQPQAVKRYYQHEIFTSHTAFVRHMKHTSTLATSNHHVPTYRNAQAAAAKEKNNV